MAITTNGGHAQRAIDFYNLPGKYIGIGGTAVWADETNPTAPAATDYRMRDMIALKLVDSCYLVKQDDNGSINYRGTHYRIVPSSLATTLAVQASLGDSSLVLTSAAGITVGSKLRVATTYEGTVTSVTLATNTVVLDTPATAVIPQGSPVVGGALVEGVNKVYISALLSYNEIPLATYRQIGLFTGVTPASTNILKAAFYADEGIDEWTSLGTLEVLDNRPPISRSADMTESLDILLEF